MKPMTESDLAEIAQADEASRRARYAGERSEVRSQARGGLGLYEASRGPRAPRLDEVLRTPSRMPRKGDKVRWAGDMSNDPHDYEVLGVEGSRMSIKDICPKGRCKHRGETRMVPAGLLSTPRWKYLGETTDLLGESESGLEERKQAADYSRGASGRSSELSWKRGPKPPKEAKKAAARGERRGKKGHIDAQMRGEDQGDSSAIRAKRALDLVEADPGERSERLARVIRDDAT